MNKIFAPFLPPWVETGLQPAFYDMESGTVLQQTARMYAKVQQLTRLFNELSEETKTEVENFEHSVNETVENFEHSVNETVSEYIEKFTQLKDFVEDYFDNLDVQEEINNKLDAMVEDGTFANLLEPLISEYEEELTSTKKLLIWDQLTYNKERDDTAECDYYITEFPLDNEYGGKNLVKVGLANDDISCSTVEYPTEFAYRKKSPLVTNAGIFYSTAEHPSAAGLVVKDGVVLKETVNPGNMYRDYLAIKEDGSMDFFPRGTNPITMINAGFKDIILGFFGLIKDGQVVDYSDYEEIGVNPRNIVCRKTNGDYLFLTCDGRTPYDKGLSISDCVRILGDYDIDFAFVLDGGGSTGTVVKGEKINKNIDSYGTKERKVATMLYVTATASDLYFLGGETNNKQKLDESAKDLQDRRTPFVEMAFAGNLFDKNSPDIKVNKKINLDTGVEEDYTNTESEQSDLLLSGYIQVPVRYDMNFVNAGDWPLVYFYDKNKKYLGYHNYTNSDHIISVPTYCVYIRINVRRWASYSYGIYLGSDYSATRFEPYKSFRYDLLFSDINGSNDVTVGNILGYKKIKIFAIDESAVQQCREILVRPSFTNIFTNFLRIQMTSDAGGQLLTSRVTVNQHTGVFTLDREYSLMLKNTPAITGAALPNESKLLITRVEAYY